MVIPESKGFRGHREYRALKVFKDPRVRLE
jgi:hypothetical protein